VSRCGSGARLSVSGRRPIRIARFEVTASGDLDEERAFDVDVPEFIGQAGCGAMADALAPLDILSPTGASIAFLREWCATPFGSRGV
jgi:hypothetical protein